MSRKMMWLVTCSGCGLTGPEDVGGGYTEASLTISGAAYAFDFCADCMNAPTSVTEFIELGVLVSKPKSKAKKVSAVEPGAVPEHARGGVIGIVPCPECSEAFKTEPGLAQHRSRKHGVVSENAAELAARGNGHLTCPITGCTFGAKAPQGLSAHMRVKHEMTLGEYKESLSA